MRLDCAGGVILSYGLKSVFGKTRPDLWESAVKEVSFSYPSGHALGSTVLYGFLAYLFATRFPRYAWLIYLLVVLLVGADWIKSFIFWRTLAHRYYWRLRHWFFMANVLYYHAEIAEDEKV